MVDIPVGPDKDAVLVFGFIIDEPADVEVAVDKLHAIAVLAVVLEVTFVEPEGVGFVDEQPVAVVEVIGGLSEKQSGCAFEQEKLAVLLELLGGQFMQLLVRIIEKVLLAVFILP